ncbi:MAG: hypothetical protein B7Z55_19800 [Planctomycetales bacterium 12-60-4]|nr:MAG: hypothetical protein B7Z55_19800 [Planctomycetales bacterium 12-60-4]
MHLTAVFVETAEGYLGFVEELAGASSRGSTMTEAREKLCDVVRELIETNRDLAEGTLSLSNLPFRKEPLLLAEI